MTIDLPADLERFFHDKVQTGRYSSAQKVVRAALERLRSQSSHRSPGLG